VATMGQLFLNSWFALVAGVVLAEGRREQGG
jgi:hypothetical protein